MPKQHIQIMHLRQQLGRLGLIITLIIAATVRLWHYDWGLPLLLHPDEWSQADVAWRISGGDLNPHFFRYSTAYMYFLAPLLKAVDWISGPLSQPDRYAVARVITALVGALTVWLIWRWAQLLMPKPWALGAAALLALNPSHVIHSHYATVDVPLTFAVCAGSYALTRLAMARPEERTRRAYAAAACIGLAIGVKYTAVLLMIPFVTTMVRSTHTPARSLGRVWRSVLVGLGLATLAGALVYWLELPQVIVLATKLTTDGRLEREYFDFLNLIFWVLSLCGVAMLALAAPRLERWSTRLLEPALQQGMAIAGAVFVCSSPFVLIDYRHSLVDIFYEYRHASIGAAAHVPEGTPGIVLPTLAENAAVYFQQLWNDFGPLLFFTVAGFMALGVSRQRMFAPVAILPLLVLAVALRSGNVADRYLLPAYPAICVIGMLGIHTVVRRFLQPWLFTSASIAAVISICALALSARLVAFALPDTRSLAYHWTAAHIPAGSRVVNENYTQTPNLQTLPITQLMANRGFDLAARWEGHADYLILGQTGAVTPQAIEALQHRYGPAILVIQSDPLTNRGPAQYIFRLSTPQASTR